MDLPSVAGNLCVVCHSIPESVRITGIREKPGEPWNTGVQADCGKIWRGDNLASQRSTAAAPKSSCATIRENLQADREKCMRAFESLSNH